MRHFRAEACARLKLTMNENVKFAGWLAGGIAAGVLVAVALKRTGGGDPIAGATLEGEAFLPANFTQKSGWSQVWYDGKSWDVAPSYIAPVGIGEASKIAAANGAQLPSPGLVDAIWQAADLKIEPLPRAHDGTTATMASPAVFNDQLNKIRDQIGGQKFRLMAGSHKDVVTDPRTGRVGLYGWHRKDGNVWQPLYLNHLPEWIDYSQGLRLVRPSTMLL